MVYNRLTRKKKKRWFYWHPINCWRHSQLKFIPTISVLPFYLLNPPHLPKPKDLTTTNPTVAPVTSSLINRRQECCFCMYFCFQYMNWNCVLLITSNLCCMKKQKSKRVYRYKYNILGNGLYINSHRKENLESLINDGNFYKIIWFM